MAHISRDEIQELWNDTQEKNWSGLARVLERHLGQVESGGSTETRMMIHVAEDMDNSGQLFPQNVDELYNLVNENIGAEERERDS